MDLDPDLLSQVEEAFISAGLQNANLVSFDVNL